MAAIEAFLSWIGFPAGLAVALAMVIRFVAALAAVYLVAQSFLLPLTERALDRRDLDAHARKPLLKLTWGLVLFAGVGVAFGFAGLTGFLTSLATIAAAAALAVGFAMQDVISNFVSGVFIYADRPFRIGDWIEWEDHSGVVEDISLRVTRVRTFDNELLTVPNSDLTSNVVKNPVAKDRLRLKVEFGIGYDDDVGEATDIIVEEAESHPDVLAEPAPSVRMTELGDSDVVLQARVWIAEPSRSDFVKTRGEFVTNVKRRFDEAGIDIPYPHRQLTGGVELADRAGVPGTAE